MPFLKRTVKDEMNDEDFIELYWSRDEQAIAQTRLCYGKRLLRIAFNILKNREDAEESENDTYFKTWNAIPPQRPTYFFAFLSRICRNISFDRLDWNNVGKRSAELVPLTEEIEQFLPDPLAGRDYEEVETADLISRFLLSVSKESRVIFVRRYGLTESVREISRALGVSESKVKSSLFESRKKLRAFLAREGVAV